MDQSPYKTIILHGFSQEDALALMRTVKAASSDPTGLIFAMSTPVSLDRPLRETLAELAAEHVHLKRSPPGKT
jgi:hypothetical protein